MDPMNRLLELMSELDMMISDIFEAPESLVDSVLELRDRLVDQAEKEQINYVK